MAQKDAPIFTPEQAKERNAPAKWTFLKDGLPLIRNTLTFLALSIALGGTVGGASRVLMLKLQTSMNAAQAQRNDARNKLLQAEKEKNEIQAYQPRYLALRERGFLGEERRLDWMEYIRQIRENRKLLPVGYEISARQAFQDNPAVAGNLELRGSRIRLRMGLLHELDLFNFLDDLSEKGFYTAQECTVKRTSTATEDPQSPKLDAECILYWLTIGERTAATGEPPRPATR